MVVASDKMGNRSWQKDLTVCDNLRSTTTFTQEVILKWSAGGYPHPHHVYLRRRQDQSVLWRSETVQI